MGARSRNLDFEDPDCCAQTDKCSVIHKSNHRRGIREPYSTCVKCLFWTLNALLHVSQGTRSLAQIGCWILLAIISLLTLGTAQLMVAQTTIQVTTTQQGVTDASHCSLQEAIYAAEFGSNTAVESDRSRPFL